MPGETRKPILFTNLEPKDPLGWMKYKYSISLTVLALHFYSCAWEIFIITYACINLHIYSFFLRYCTIFNSFVYSDTCYIKNSFSYFYFVVWCSTSWHNVYSLAATISDLLHAVYHDFNSFLPSCPLMYMRTLAITMWIFVTLLRVKPENF